VSTLLPKLTIGSLFVFALLLPCLAGTGEKSPSIPPTGATVIPFYGTGGKVPADLAESLTRGLVEGLRKRGGLATVATGYPKGRRDERLRVRPYRVKFGTHCWVVIEVGQGPHPPLFGAVSSPTGCDSKQLRKVFARLQPAVEALAREGASALRTKDPMVGVSIFREGCEGIASKAQMFGLSFLLAARLVNHMRVVPHRWLVPEMRLPGARKEPISVVRLEDLSADELDAFRIKPDLVQAKALGVPTLVVPKLKSKPGGCSLEAEFFSSASGKSIAVVQAGMVGTAEEMPAALGRLIEKIAAVSIPK
jgi:hypothetical protein